MAFDYPDLIKYIDSSYINETFTDYYAHNEENA